MDKNRFIRFHVPIIALLALLLIGVAGFLFVNNAQSADTPDPDNVTIAGSLQSELGCPGDWDPACASTHLANDAEDAVWQEVFDVPAGSWEYKAALNDGWSENYGQNAAYNGANIPLTLATPTPVKFYYSHETHWITDNQNSIIAVAPGNFQSELGCSGDWQPDCLRSWLQDPDGDGIYTFSTSALPAGSYEVKVAIDERWNENYGTGGVQNGSNISFTVPNDCTEMLFSYNAATHVLTVDVASPALQPTSITIAGSLQSELGCAGDWDPACSATHLTYDTTDKVWQGTLNVPTGSWEYKAALNNSWDENYGLNATSNGANIPLSLTVDTAVKFYYDHDTHWVTDNQAAVIAVAPGSFQSELGCAGDWQPDCLRSWLQDPDGDGIYTFSTRSLPAGNYEVKVAINESWDENYGAGGVQNGPNISFTVPAACGEIFFSYDAATHVLTVSAYGAPKGNLKLAQAYWVSEDTIAWNAGNPSSGDFYQLHFAPDGGLTLEGDGVMGGEALDLVYNPAGLGDVLAKFPHLDGYSAFTLSSDDLIKVLEILKGQVVISAKGPDGNHKDATGLQIQGVLDDLFTYNGDLGVTFAGMTPTLQLWAPTAKSVKLHLFENEAAATPLEIFSMNVDPDTGVWSITGSPSWDRKYYLYEVEVFVRSTGQVEHNLVTDPYSFSIAKNSMRSQIVNLDDNNLKPAGWDSLAKPPLDAFEDIVLYELHIRDFSSADLSVPVVQRSTYLAFTQTGSNGMQHLSEMARAGLTHVHLLPSFDIATINEDKSSWLEPEGDLASFPPDSEKQQARVMAVADQDGFNWGYDPYHYTVPEGSYATDASGVTRIVEFRQMVQALNQAGLRVVMDVVYNHTNASGQNDKSVLDKIVPGYYHRLNADGNVETSTCCQNTATEFSMMEKLMIDSALTWVEAYKVDGFRFDLMGHHSRENMLNLRTALDSLMMENSGVDGSKVYIYGEAWNFGEVANDARFIQATQMNMGGTGIGSFNDRLRDGVRGGGPFSGLQEQGFINGLYYDPNGTSQGSSLDQLNTLLLRSDWIRLSLAGNLKDYEFVDRNGNLISGYQLDYNGQQAGYTSDPQENILYVEAHDNETLFDALQLKTPVLTSMADRVRIQNLGNSIVLLGQGVPFFQAGQDILRSKSMDRNSYNSGDWFNAIDWSLQSTNWGRGLPMASENQSNWPIMQPLLADPALMPATADIERAANHYQEMLNIRKSTTLFRLQTADDVINHLTFYNTGPDQIPGLIVMGLFDDAGEIDRVTESLVVLFNANDDSQNYQVDELVGLDYILHPVLQVSTDLVVRTASFDKTSGIFSVPARTTAVYVLTRSAAEQLALLKMDVQKLVAENVLNAGQGKSLISKIDIALSRLAQGKEQKAVSTLQAFISQVNSLELEGILTFEQAEALRKAALDTITTIQND